MRSRLGSNRRSRHGSPAATLRAALAAIDGVQAVSAIRTTPALGPAGRSFANAVAIVESELAPDAMLAELKAIERAFGRRPGRRWGPRVLDLDIILWSDGAWGGPGPIVPHPDFRDARLRAAAARRDRAGLARPAQRRHRRQLLARLTAPRPTPR